MGYTGNIQETEKKKCTEAETALGQAMFRTALNGMVSEGLLEEVTFHLRSENRQRELTGEVDAG